MDRSEPATEVTFCRLAAAFVSSGSGGHSRDPRPSAERTGPASPDRGVGGTIRATSPGWRDQRETRGGRPLGNQSRLPGHGGSGGHRGREDGDRAVRCAPEPDHAAADAAPARCLRRIRGCHGRGTRTCLHATAGKLTAGNDLFPLRVPRPVRSLAQDDDRPRPPEGPRRRSPFPTPPGVPPCYIPAGNIRVSGIAAVRRRQGDWG